MASVASHSMSYFLCVFRYLIHEQNKASAYQVPTRDLLSTLAMFNHRPGSKSPSVSLHHTPAMFNSLYWHHFFRDTFCLHYNESPTHLRGV